MKHVTYLKKLNTNALSLATAVALVVCGFTTGCSSQNIQPADSANREVINQVSLLQGLTFGDYNGSVKVGRLKQLGDTGIGTFDRLNGELIMLDGVVYRARYDGAIEVVDNEETVPFANVTFLDADKTFELNSLNNIGDLKTELNKKIKESGNNRFYVVRIDGTFDKIGYRSEYAQKKPYKPLAKVMETDQTFFENKNVKGTVVGLYCPEYMGDLNAVGWHFHFITADKKAGGHVFEVNAKNLTVTMDRTDNFFMILPDNEMFNSFDLTIDQSEDIKKVETGEK